MKYMGREFKSRKEVEKEIERFYGEAMNDSRALVDKSLKLEEAVLEGDTKHIQIYRHDCEYLRESIKVAMELVKELKDIIEEEIEQWQ